MLDNRLSRTNAIVPALGVLAALMVSSAPAPHSAGPITSETITHIVRLRLASPEDATMFANLAKNMAGAVGELEPGAYSYEWFINSDKTEAGTFERFADYAAFKLHNSNARANIYADYMPSGSPPLRAMGALDVLENMFIASNCSLPVIQSTAKAFGMLTCFSRFAGVEY